MSQAEDMVKINWDLRELWRSVGRKSKKLWCLYCVYSDNMNNAKNFQKQQSNVTFIIFLDSTKLRIVWIKITTFFKRRVSIIL